MTRTNVVATAALPIFLVALMPSTAGAAPQQGFPGNSLASPLAQSDVAQNVDMLETAFAGDCKSSRVVYTEVTKPPARPGVSSWTERWTVDRCGTDVYYEVALRPGKRGGTDFGLGLIEGTPPDVIPRPTPQSAPAETSSRWQKITEFHQMVFFADLGALTIDGSVRTVWELRDLKWMSRSGAWSFLLQSQYDCGQSRYRVLSFRSVSGHMGEGEVIQSETPPDEWETDFTAESPAAAIRHAVCEAAAPVAEPQGGSGQP